MYSTVPTAKHVVGTFFKVHPQLVLGSLFYHTRIPPWSGLRKINNENFLLLGLKLRKIAASFVILSTRKYCAVLFLEMRFFSNRTTLKDSLSFLCMKENWTTLLRYTLMNQISIQWLGERNAISRILGLFSRKGHRRQVFQFVTFV